MVQTLCTDDEDSLVALQIIIAQESDVIETYVTKQLVSNSDDFAGLESVSINAESADSEAQTTTTSRTQPSVESRLSATDSDNAWVYVLMAIGMVLCLLCCAFIVMVQRIRRKDKKVSSVMDMDNAVAGVAVGSRSNSSKVSQVSENMAGLHSVEGTESRGRW